MVIHEIVIGALLPLSTIGVLKCWLPSTRAHSRPPFRRTSSTAASNWTWMCSSPTRIRMTLPRAPRPVSSTWTHRIQVRFNFQKAFVCCSPYMTWHTWHECKLFICILLALLPRVNSVHYNHHRGIFVCPPPLRFGTSSGECGMRCNMVGWPVPFKLGNISLINNVTILLRLPRARVFIQERSKRNEQDFMYV